MKNEDKDRIKEWMRCCEIREGKIVGDGKYRGRGERGREKMRNVEKRKDNFNKSFF